MQALFPPQVLSGLAEPLLEDEAPQVATRLSVQQGYAQVVQICLSRTSHSPFDLTGLQAYTDVQALVQSLGRCLSRQEDPTLRAWRALLQECLSRYQAAFGEVAEAQSWIGVIRQVLDAAGLPSEQNRGAGADAVARQLAQVLGELADRQDLSAWLQSVREHVCGVSERYWSGLFVCYEVVGVPRTNNDLEALFGLTRQRIRQQTGAKQVRRVIARSGAWLIYPCDADVEALQQRLAGVRYEVYQQERAQFEQRQGRFRQRLRWRRNRSGVLDELEAQWASLCANSTL